MAASTLFCLPVVVLFFVAQRYFMKGISFSGLKG
jgi:multiple sugar transport system permease protein